MVSIVNDAQLFSVVIMMNVLFCFRNSVLFCLRNSEIRGLEPYSSHRKRCPSTLRGRLGWISVSSSERRGGVVL